MSLLQKYNGESVMEDDASFMDIALESNSINSELNYSLMDLREVSLALEELNDIRDSLEASILSDKRALSNESIDSEYIRFSMENFSEVCSIFGLDEVVTSLEDINADPSSSLKSLIERKEASLEDIGDKIGDVIKGIKERFKNTMSLIRTSFKNKHKLIKELSDIISKLDPNDPKEITPATEKALSMLLSTVGFLKLTKLDGKSFKEGATVLYEAVSPVEMLKITNSNLQAMVDKDFDPALKLEPVPFKTRESKDIEEALKNPKKNKDGWFNKKVDFENIIGMVALAKFDFKYFSGDWTFEPAAPMLVRTGRKPTLFRGATKYRVISSKTTGQIQKEVEVVLPTVNELKEWLSVAKTGLDNQSNFLGEIDKSYKLADAVGDYGPYLFLNDLLTINQLGGDRVNNYVLHAIRVASKHYSTK